jgi:Predicted esterase
MLSEFFIKKFECILNDSTVVIAPEGSNRFYLESNYYRVGASWMTKLDKEKDIEDNISYIQTLYSNIVDEIGHTNFKLNTLGFSQGGATLVRWIMSNSINIDSLILWGSDIPKDCLTEEKKSRWNSIDVKLVIGNQDEYINEENKQKVIDLISSYGLKYELVAYKGSHKIIEKELEKIATGL